MLTAADPNSLIARWLFASVAGHFQFEKHKNLSKYHFNALAHPTCRAFKFSETINAMPPLSVPRASRVPRLRYNNCVVFDVVRLCTRCAFWSAHFLVRMLVFLLQHKRTARSNVIHNNGGFCTLSDLPHSASGLLLFQLCAIRGQKAI